MIQQRMLCTLDTHNTHIHCTEDELWIGQNASCSHDTSSFANMTPTERIRAQVWACITVEIDVEIDVQL